MTAADGWDQDDGPCEGDDPDEPDYDDDPQDGYEPDPEDGDIARSYEEYYDHCDQVHGGGECTCRPSPAEQVMRRARESAYAALGAWYRLKAAARQPWTLRLGPAEVTVRLRAGRKCGACSGRGWLYTLTSKPEFPIPPGYNGAALCGCGSAIARLADTRRTLRRRVRGTQDEPPF